MSQCGFAKPGRAMKKCVVQGFIPLVRRLDEYFQVFQDLILAGKVIECNRPQSTLNIVIFSGEMFACWIEILVHVHTKIKKKPFQKGKAFIRWLADH